MKTKLKSLLALVLSVLIGQVCAADPVATWTDFNTLTSGDYTLVENGNTISDGVLTIGSKPSYIAGTTTWDPRATGNAVVLAMRVTNLDLTKVSALISLKLGDTNDQLGLMTDGEGGLDAMWNGGIRGGNNAISAKLSLAATEYIVVFKYSDWGTQAWAIGNDGVFAQYTSDSACKGGTNTAGADIRIGALYDAGSPATGLQIHSMWLWNTNESIDAVIAACATEEMKTNRAFVENGTGAEYTATVAEDVNLSEIIWTKVADDTTVTTANLPNGAKLKIDASNNPVITSDVVFANKLIYTANPLTVTAAITPNQNDYSAIIPGIVSNPSYEIFPAGLFVGPGAVTYTATLNAPLGYEIVVAGNRATLKTVDSATLGIPSFGVNFYNNDAAKVAGTEAQGAYPIKSAAWTDVRGNSSEPVTSFSLADKDGNISENAEMSMVCAAAANPYGLDGTPPSALLKGYIDDSNGNPTTLTFSNIPYAQYRVIVYMSTDTANSTFAPVSIGGISYASTVGNSATATVASSSNWGHTGPNHNANALAEGVNYLVSPMMTSDSCVISTVRKNNGPRATIAAVQFIDCTAENRELTVPGQEITLDANTNISDIDFTETKVLITVKPGVTLTFDKVVTLDSLRVVAEGTAENPVKFDATVTAPFANIGSVSLEGTAVELVADIYVDAKPNKPALEVIAIASNAAATADTPQEVASTIAIASGKTLKTRGYLNFTAANNTIVGTLEVVSGVTKFYAAEQGIKGVLTIDSGATFVNTRPGDALAYNTSGVEVNVYGTLDMGSTRWTIFANNNTINAYAGATITGVGQSGNGALDVWEKADENNDNVAFNIYKNGENASDVTVFATIRYREKETVFNIAEGMTANLAGTNANINTIYGGLKVKGSGVLKLSDKNAYADTYGAGIKIDSGATLMVNHVEALGSQNIVNNGTLELDVGNENVTFNREISGSGNINVASGVLTLQGTSTISGSMTIAEGAKVIVDSGESSAFAENLEESAGVNVNGTIEFLSSGMLYRSFAGNGVVAVKGDVAINNTGNNGKLTGLSRFKGSVIVDEGKTLTLTFWNNGYDIELSELEVNGSVTGNKGNGYATTLNLTTTKLSGSGTISGVDTFTLADGATLAGAVTVTGDVTVEGTVNVSGEAGATVLTCANAASLDLTKFAAPAGLKCVADDTAVKLAVATVNVTIPAAPENTKWFMGETEVSGTIAVDPNTDVTLTLKADEGYAFADGTIFKDYTVNSGENGATVETPDVTVEPVSNKVAKIGETEYETLQAAVNEAGANATVELLADTTENITVPAGFTGTIDLGDKTVTGYLAGSNVELVLQNGYIIHNTGDKPAIKITGGSLELNNIYLESHYHGIQVDGTATCIINSGTYKLTSGDAGYALVYPYNANASITVNGGNFYGAEKATDVPALFKSKGLVTVNGGYFQRNLGYTVYISSGNVVITGGEFNGLRNYTGSGSGSGIVEYGGGKFTNDPTSADARERMASGYIGDDTINPGYYTVAKAYNVAKTIDATKVTVSGLNDAYACGGKASFTVAANEGYNLTGVTLDGEALTADENGNYTFTMPEKDVAIVVTTESTSTFDVMINGQPVADADALKLAANSTTTMAVPETSTWTAEGNVLKKDGEAYVTFADYYTVVVNGTSVTLKLNKPVIGESAEGADDAFTVSATEVAIKISNYNSDLKYGVRIAADINGLGSAAITPVEPNDGVITLEKSGDSAFYEVVVSDVDFPATPAE